MQISDVGFVPLSGHINADTLVSCHPPSLPSCTHILAEDLEEMINIY